MHAFPNLIHILNYTISIARIRTYFAISVTINYAKYDVDVVQKLLFPCIL